MHLWVSYSPSPVVIQRYSDDTFDTSNQTCCKKRDKLLELEVKKRFISVNILNELLKTVTDAQIHIGVL